MFHIGKSSHNFFCTTTYVCMYAAQVTMVWLQLTSMCLVTFMCADRYVAARNCVHCKPPAQAATSLTRVRLSVVVIATLALAISSLPLFGLAPPALSPSGQLCRSWLTSHPIDTLGHDDVRHHVFYVAYLTIGYANVTIALMVNVSLIVNLCAARGELDFLSVQIMYTCETNATFSSKIKETKSRNY